MEKFKNKVFNDDVMKILAKMPDNSVDMIYGDPDYNVGINYAGKNYKAKWDDYIDWYIKLTQECIRVLKPTGNLFMMNYPKQNAHLRVKYLDDNAFNVQDYVWTYNTNVGHTPRRFTTAHRSILHATKSKNNNFYKEQVALPYQNPQDKRIKGRIAAGHLGSMPYSWFYFDLATKSKNNNFYKEQVALPYQNPQDKRIKGRIAAGHLGSMPYSWFYFDLVKNVSKDKTFHACQIPLSLVEMLIKSCTKVNDDVFVLFGGSGSELTLCKKLKRNFISCEIHPEYYKMINDRLLHDGKIRNKYKLDFIRFKKQKISQEFSLFNKLPYQNA